MSQKSCAFVLYVEGDTEYYFFNRIFEKLNCSQKFPNTEFKVTNLRGIGNFKSKSIGKHSEYLRKRNSDIPTYIFFCYDHDVWERAHKPSFDFIELKKTFEREFPETELIDNCIAYQQIEDWFLCDLSGICNYLGIKLGKNSKLSGETATKKLKVLFSRVNKVYLKGKNQDSGRFIDNLNLEIIIQKKLTHLIEKINGICSAYEKSQ